MDQENGRRRLDRRDEQTSALAKLSALRADRLAGMAATYEVALAELHAWNDPAVAGLTGRLKALQAETRRAARGRFALRA